MNDKKDKIWVFRHKFWAGLIGLVILYIILGTVTLGRPTVIQFQSILVTYLMGWGIYILVRTILKLRNRKSNNTGQTN
jgi:hypothetical protein